MAAAVYILSALISLASAVLLLRSFMRTRTSLLFWAGLCFIGLTLNNLLLLVEEEIVTGADLSTWRALPALLGTLVLVYGLVTEQTRP